MKLVINSHSGTVNRQYFVQTFLCDIINFNHSNAITIWIIIFQGKKRKRKKETIKIIINKAVQKNCRDYIYRVYIIHIFGEKTFNLKPKC